MLTKVFLVMLIVLTGCSSLATHDSYRISTEGCEVFELDINEGAEGRAVEKPGVL